MARSGYMEAKVNRWSEVKELVIEDCDLATFNLIVDYMYGIALPESMLSSSNDAEGIRQDLEKMKKLLGMSDRLLMVDLKEEVEEMIIKAFETKIRQHYTVELYTVEFVEVFKLAENFDLSKLLRVCVKEISSDLKRGFAGEAKEEDVNRMRDLFKLCARISPSFAAELLVAFTFPDQ